VEAGWVDNFWNAGVERDLRICTDGAARAGKRFLVVENWLKGGDDRGTTRKGFAFEKKPICSR
jgi:hypothetical protein